MCGIRINYHDVVLCYYYLDNECDVASKQCFWETIKPPSWDFGWSEDDGRHFLVCEPAFLQ